MKKNSCIHASGNFEFLAMTFARMEARGREVNMSAVTGNMDDRQREWFLERYRFWLASYTGNAGETDKSDITR
ncbi:TPA: glycogen synthase [Salmonella enterica subsp. enterica serovar Reading]|nr:glycogen synthase [Salmonella enterica subsp. enterica]ELP2193423.1 glycogen synthase [Salmonella enterica subsp. enterica serovar Champaign]MKU04656.1 glycogen synthase [Salmonella enterica subsp. enterica serovar Kinondoni]HAF2409728.1 glycogen synthase [Salmonella enterica]HCL0956642.1 glycogen synthase [Salmonella enterica subsp. enterica serovar Muenchen]